MTKNGSTPIPADQVDEHNKHVEQSEIDWLKTGPERMTLYVRQETKEQPFEVITWLGTHLAYASVGQRAYIGFDRWTYRRSVTARIFGTLYHGWYMESSGEYCRLKKAKRQ
jgi:hypothetical protein